jgi:hypothetical protein
MNGFGVKQRSLAGLRGRVAYRSPQLTSAANWMPDLGGHAADRTDTPDILRDQWEAEVHRVTMTVLEIQPDAGARTLRDLSERRLAGLVDSLEHAARSASPTPPDEATYLPGLLSDLHRQPPRALR